MEKKIKVSIILPILNGRFYIDESISSFLEQSMKETELIVVDAGSTDGTWERALEYQKQDGRIRAVLSDKKSVGRQSNIGLDMAKGEYIGFLEDDILPPDMCERLYNSAREADLDWIKGDYTMFMDTSERRLFLEVAVIKDKSLKNRVFNPKERPEILRWDANHWKGIYKSSFLRENGIRFNETHGAAFQDTGFIQQVYVCSESAMYIDGSCYLYRRDNMSGSTFSKKGLSFFLHEFEFILERTKGKKNREYFLKDIYLRAAMMLFAQAGKLPCNDEQVLTMQTDLQRLSGHIAYAAKEGWISEKDFTPEQWLNLQVARNSPEIFLKYYPVRCKCENDRYREALERLKSREGIILCGYGDEAKKWEMLMLCNRVAGYKAIADNNGAKQGTKSANGIPIMSLEEAAAKCPGALFFIPSLREGTVQAICKQLVSHGIKHEEVYRPGIWLHPYTATTVF